MKPHKRKVKEVGRVKSQTGVKMKKKATEKNLKKKKK